ncbi:hypothetical protein Tco_0763754 [Tanacetum coccineum]
MGRQNSCLNEQDFKRRGLRLLTRSPRGVYINQSNYASDIVKKYGLHTTDSVDTPLLEKSKLDEDLQGTPIDATLYHGMIRSLMYLTSSRPDLIYAVCLCAWYQAKPIEKHLQAVKRIFRYLKGTINMGLEYSKDIEYSIDEGPFQMGTTRVIVAEGTEGSLHLVLHDLELCRLSQDEKDRCFWEDRNLTKEDRESHLYDDFEHFRQIKRRNHSQTTMSDLPKLINDSGTSRWNNVNNTVELKHYHSQSSTIPPTTYHQPLSADTSQSDLGLSPTDNLIENLTNTLAFLTQSYKTFIPQNNNHLRNLHQKPKEFSYSTRRQGCLFRNVLGRQNRGQGNKCTGEVAAGYGGRITEKDVADASQENGVSLDEEQLLFLLAGGHDMLMMKMLYGTKLVHDNLSSAIMYDEAVLSYDSGTYYLRYKDHDHFQDANCSYWSPEPPMLHRARQVRYPVYVCHVIVTPNHAPAVVRDGEETLELTEISRKKMHDKMKANECVDNKVNITPPDYSKENFLATFTPQKQLTPEQIFWSQDIVKMKAEALKVVELPDQ